MFTVYGLQKIADVLIENPSWSIAHLVANFNLIDLISNPKVLDLIDYPDHTTLMTPFQVCMGLASIYWRLRCIECVCVWNVSVFNTRALSWR